LPHNSLLTPQAEPDCEVKSQMQPSQTERNTEQVKLDCYRQAELIIRTRLHLLQASVAETIKVISDSGPVPNIRPDPPRSP
jgi:hypothetical protein